MKPQILSTEPVAALCATANRCFAAAGDSVLFLDADRVVARLRHPLTASDHVVRALAADARWLVLGTYAGRLFRIKHGAGRVKRGSRWIRCKSPTTYPVLSLAFDATGNLWVGSYEEVFFQKPFAARWSHVTVGREAAAMCPTADGGLLVGLASAVASERLVLLSPSSSTPEEIGPLPCPSAIHGPPAGVWIAVGADQLWICDRHTIKRLSLPRGHSALCDVHVGRDGVCVGTNNGLLHAAPGKPFQRTPGSEAYHVTGNPGGLYIGGPAGLSYLPMDASVEPLSAPAGCTARPA